MDATDRRALFARIATLESDARGCARRGWWEAARTLEAEVARLKASVPPVDDSPTSSFADDLASKLEIR